MARADLRSSYLWSSWTSPCQFGVGDHGNFGPLRDAKQAWHLCWNQQKHRNLSTASFEGIGSCSPSLCLQAGKGDVVALVEKDIQSNSFQRRLSYCFAQISPGTLCESVCTQQ